MLLDLYDKYPPATIADLAGRSIGYIRCIASAMGLKSKGRGQSHAPLYSTEDVKLIKQCYGRESVAALARHLGRTPDAIHAKASKLGIGRRRGRLWGAKDDAVLRELYPQHGAKCVAEKLFRSVDAVKHRARKLGVRREPFEHPWRREYRFRLGEAPLTQKAAGEANAS